MPVIEMERAFSALASPVRLPSPPGWAGMMGAFGAPRFAGAVECGADIERGALGRWPAPTPLSKAGAS